MDCGTPGLPSLTISQSLPKFMSIALVVASSHIILRSLLLLLPSVFPSIRDFSSESVCIRWPGYWSCSLSISPYSECPELISLKIDWFDLLAIQGPLKSLVQHHSLKASALWHAAFSMVQLSQLWMTDGKTELILDYMDLCQQSTLCFSAHCLGLS